MKCPSCHQESLDSKEIYWSNVRSPVSCGNCKEKYYINSFFSRAYWAIQLGGLGILFIPFIAFYWNGVFGVVLSLSAIFGLGIFIRYLELKYSELKHFSSKIEKQQKLLEKAGMVLVLLLFLGLWISLAVNVTS
jgi:hypothetical protein